MVKYPSANSEFSPAQSILFYLRPSRGLQAATGFIIRVRDSGIRYSLDENKVNKSIYRSQSALHILANKILSTSSGTSIFTTFEAMGDGSDERPVPPMSPPASRDPSAASGSDALSKPLAGTEPPTATPNDESQEDPESVTLPQDVEYENEVAKDKDNDEAEHRFDDYVATSSIISGDPQMPGGMRAPDETVADYL